MTKDGAVTHKDCGGVLVLAQYKNKIILVCSNCKSYWDMNLPVVKHEEFEII